MLLRSGCKLIPTRLSQVDERGDSQRMKDDAGESIQVGDVAIASRELPVMLAMKAYRRLCRAARTNRCHSCIASDEWSPLPRF